MPQDQLPAPLSGPPARPVVAAALLLQGSPAAPADAGVEPAAGGSARKRRRGSGSAGADPASAAAAAVEAPPSTSAGARKKRKSSKESTLEPAPVQKGAAPAAAERDGREDPAARGGGTDSVDNGRTRKRAVATTRRRRRAATGAATTDAEPATAAGGDDAEPTGDAGRAVAAKKPPRRTKAVVQEEVRQDALLGVFAPHVSLHERYPHSREHAPGAVALTPQALAVAEAENARLAASPAVALSALTGRAALEAVGALCGIAAAAAGGGSEAVDASDEQASGEEAEATAHPAAAVAGEEDDEEAEPSESRRGKRGGKAGGKAAKPAADPPVPALLRPIPPLVPNLGYACLCATLRAHDIFTSRDTNKAGFQAKGLAHVSRLALANARDLLPQIQWNEAHGIRLFRLSSGIFPWMSFYTLDELPDADGIKQALADAGAVAKRLGHRLTFHPSEFTKIASDKPEVVETSVKELEVHSLIFDLMGFLPATVYNKINIHVGGVYGDKIASMDRFAKASGC
ncbi:hypothetical protein GPECTOR_2g1454 [Gonium pectorale]|uniref:UV-endonuclease UvdE n=1 Tax=Gonium pectorale TaxID=33097 RepID=A0A150H1L5_GONPE|nr:hypothetical protein GPECTOR_2g1454 [Gonium pectorale]|eukprot:KXZ55903.1 hypothetical protein GPECTOR_2g1454 [Gonium pectorale]